MSDSDAPDKNPLVAAGLGLFFNWLGLFYVSAKEAIIAFLGVSAFSCVVGMTAKSLQSYYLAIMLTNIACAGWGYMRAQEMSRKASLSSNSSGSGGALPHQQTGAGGPTGGRGGDLSGHEAPGGASGSPGATGGFDRATDGHTSDPGMGGETGGEWESTPSANSGTGPGNGPQTGGGGLSDALPDSDGHAGRDRSDARPDSGGGLSDALPDSDGGASRGGSGSDRIRRAAGPAGGQNPHSSNGEPSNTGRAPSANTGGGSAGVDPIADKLPCPKCDNVIRENFNVCMDCGHVVEPNG